MDRVCYRVDALDRVTTVSDGWVRALRDTGKDALAPSDVIGRPLWDLIKDPTVQHLYRSVMARARSGLPIPPFSFRCDTPDRQQMMRMEIRADETDAVSFEVRVVASQARLPLALLLSETPRSQQVVKMCAWCQRVALPDARWVEVEEAVDVLAFLDAVPVPIVSHGICPACYIKVMFELNRKLEDGDAETVFGSLPLQIPTAPITPPAMRLDLPLESLLEDLPRSAPETDAAESSPNL